MAEKVRGFLFTDIGYFLTKLPLNTEKGKNGNNPHLSLLLQLDVRVTLPPSSLSSETSCDTQGEYRTKKIVIVNWHN